MYNKFLKLIEERGIKTSKVAKDTNIVPSTFSDWKKGKSSPKIGKLMILAKYFGVPLEYFLTMEDEDVKPDKQ